MHLNLLSGVGMDWCSQGRGSVGKPRKLRFRMYVLVRTSMREFRDLFAGVYLETTELALSRSKTNRKVSALAEALL